MKDNSTNYYGEPIPHPNGLIDECLEIIEGINGLPKYRFNELFIGKEFNNKVEYSRNDAIWRSMYNNWSKTYYDINDRPDHLKKNEVKGIYIFYKDDVPQYVGISRKVLTRLKNHFLGTSHFQATLVYLMLRDKHDRLNGIYKEERAKLPLFQAEREQVQSEMRDNWKISIKPIEESYRLYMTEVLLACHLKTRWNSFETH